MNLLTVLSSEYLNPVESALQDSFKELRSKFTARDLMINFTDTDETSVPKLAISVVNAVDTEDLTEANRERLIELFPSENGEDELFTSTDGVIIITQDVHFNLNLSSEVDPVEGKEVAETPTQPPVVTPDQTPADAPVTPAPTQDGEQVPEPQVPVDAPTETPESDPVTPTPTEGDVPAGEPTPDAAPVAVEDSTGVTSDENTSNVDAGPSEG